MFRHCLSNTPLTTNAADSYFSNIIGSDYNGDYTFLATIRALLSPRIKDGEKISLCFNSSTYTRDNVQNNKDDVVITAIYRPSSYIAGNIMVHSFCNSYTENNAACMEIIKSSFCDVYPGWTRIEKVTEFYRKSFAVACFVNVDQRKVAIFVDNLDMRKMHYLQCAILAFLPWYFNPEDGVTADEMDLIQSLREKTPDKYEAAIAKIASKHDFRSAQIKNLLADFEVSFEKREKSIVERDIERRTNDIMDAKRRLAECLHDKRELEIRLLGLETRIANGSGESEIMEYFLCNKKLYLNCVTNSVLSFCAKDYLTYFDEEMAKAAIDNERSYVYNPGRSCNDIIPREDMKKLMYAIFIDQILKMKFCAAYNFNLGERVDALSGYEYDVNFDDCMPNPHTDRYRCMGDYERAINERIIENDYIGALEQAVASCKSLNFGDSVVMQVFMKRMYGIDGYTQNKCIELPDGNIVDPKHAIAWLKKKEAEEQKEAEQNENTVNSNGDSNTTTENDNV